MANTLQIKRGLESNIPTLSEAEPAFTTDAGEFYVGDGSNNYRFIPGDQYVKTTSDVTFNTVSASAGIDAGSSAITNVADPSNAQDAATKGYTDAIEQGLDLKDSVRAATDGSSIDLAATTDPNPIDGVTLSDGDRVLLKDQATASENGIYDTVTATDPTTWTRSEDMDEDADVTSGLFTFVEEGTVNNNGGFVLTTPNDTLGTIAIGSTDLNFTQFSGAGQITAGTGLNKSGDTINHDSASVHESGGAVEVSHDSLAGFVANEHIDHSGVSISSGTGLSGGGDITASRTLSLDASIADLNDAALPNATAAGQLLVWNATNGQYENAGVTAGSGISKTEGDALLTLSADEANIDHNALLNFVANEHLDWTIEQGDTSTAMNIDDANINQTAVTQYSYAYSDLSLGIDDTPVDAETAQPISSNWAYTHTNTATGVHGAGSFSLLNSGSTIDCGAF